MAEVKQVKTLPPWIDSYNPRLGVPSDEHLSPLEPQLPQPSILPQHNSQPNQPQRPGVHSSSSSNSKNSRSTNRQQAQQHNQTQPVSPDGYADSSQERLPLKSRRPRNLQQLFTGKGPSKWDHLRSADPVIVPNRSQHPWAQFVASSRYGTRIPNEHSEIVDDDVLDRMQPGLNEPVRLPSSAGGDTVHSKRSRARRATPFFERMLMVPVRHPLGPLFCRLTVLATSVIALALSANIVQLGRSRNAMGELRQAIFAVAVDTVAIPYIGYITWDDNMGPPLGLRRTKERVKLILMDLFFIMFKAASTGLAFESLIAPTEQTALRLVRALAVFELIGLMAWAMTLIANVFRVVERLGG